MTREAHALVSVDAFLALIREHPDLFPPMAIATRGRLHKATVYNILKPPASAKSQSDPKVSTLQRMAHGCGARILIQMPVSTARDLQSANPSRD